MIVQMFVQIVAFSSFRYIFRSGIAKSFDDLYVIIWGTPILFDTAVEPFYNATTIEKRFQSLHILTNTYNFLFFWLISHQNWYTTISHCGFDVHFSVDAQCGVSFRNLICHLFVFFDEMSVKVFDSLFQLIFWFSYCWVLRALSVFWVTAFYQMCLLQIFYPQSVACLPSLTLFFSKQKVLT